MSSWHLICVYHSVVASQIFLLLPAILCVQIWNFSSTDYRCHDSIPLRSLFAFLLICQPGKTIFLINPDPSVIDNMIAELQTRFDITDEGDIADYVGVNVTHLPDGKLKLTQPNLIKSIIKDVNFALNTKPKDTPAQTTKILGPDTRGQDHSAEWNYRAVIGKLNYLEKSTRGEISYAVHQCARFSSNPKKSHSDAVHRIVRYLVGTQNEGVLLDPKEPMFEVWCDADFCGLWDK